MAVIIEKIREVITPDVIRGASSVIGEDPTATQNVLNAAIPAVLGGLVRTGSTQAGAEHLHSIIKDGRYGPATVSDFSGALGGGTATDSLLRSGENIVSGLFGDRTERVTDAVASSSGVNRNSAANALRLAAPLVLGTVGSEVASRSLDARGLMNLLSGERSSIQSALPPDVSRAVGMEEPVPTPRAQTTEREPARRTEREREPRVRERRPGGSRWTPAVIAGLAILVLLFFLARGRQQEKIRVAVPPATELPTPQPTPAVPSPTRPMPEMAAASMNEINSFLANPSAGATPRNFVLSGVIFQQGSSQLTPEASSSVNSLAGMLKAHPTARVRIEGFTDSQGNAASNKTLSRARADAVKKALVAQGVPATNISTEGYGGARPIAANSTDAGRAQNRRIELVILSR